MLIAMNGPPARGLCRCSARATSSLPVPDSPVISTVDVRLREPADRAEHFLHRRRLAEDLGRLAAAASSVDFLAQALLDRAADQLDRLVDVEGLGQVLEGAALERRRPRSPGRNTPS